MRWPWMQKFDANSFRSENWANLSNKSRRAQMQALENSIAKSQGRTPREVIIDSSISNGGFYSPDGKGGGTIHVSENDVHNNSFECMDTILHEGRHAYQDDVINDRITNEENEKTKEAWAHDDAHGCYISSNEGAYCDYFYQPQETDAYGFAKAQMDNMSTNFQDDPQYQNYVTNRDYNENIAKAEGIQKYGVDNEQDIKDAVREKVEDRYEAHQNQILNKPLDNSSQELSSRFATGRVDGRYLTGTENIDLFNDYNNKYDNKELEFHSFPQSDQPIVMTNSGNIHGIDTWGDSEENFWNHHGNTHNDYKEIASHIPEVQERLNAGQSIETIRQDLNLKNCADAYFNENNMPEAVKYGNTYIHNDDGRHRILAAQEHGYDMPIKVVGEYTGKGESVDPSLYNDAYDIKHDNNPYESQNLVGSDENNQNLKELPQENQISQTDSNENESKSKVQGENNLASEEQPVGEEDFEGEEQPEDEDNSEGEEQPEGKDNSEGEEQPEVENNFEGEEQPEVEDNFEGEEQPETEDSSEGEEQPEGEDNSEGEEQSEGEDNSEGEEQSETEDSSEGEEQPEVEDNSEDDEQPEGEDNSEDEEQPEGKDNSEGEEQPEVENNFEGEEQPEVEDNFEGEEQPETEDSSEGEEQPEGEDNSEDEEQSEAEDNSEGEEQSETEDNSKGEEQPETEDNSKGEEQPEGEDNSEGEEQPEAEDNSESEEQSDGEDNSEGEDKSAESSESPDSGESEGNDYDYGYGY